MYLFHYLTVGSVIKHAFVTQQREKQNFVSIPPQYIPRRIL